MERAIIKVVEAVTGITFEQMCSRCRYAEITAARHLAMYLLSRHTGLTLSTIGRMFGRHHATVLHGIRKVRDRRDIDRRYRRETDQIIEAITKR